MAKYFIFAKIFAKNLCQRTRWLGGQDNDYKDINGKFWRPLTDFKGTISGGWLCGQVIFQLGNRISSWRRESSWNHFCLCMWDRGPCILLSKKQKRKISWHCNFNGAHLESYPFRAVRSFWLSAHLLSLLKLLSFFINRRILEQKRPYTEGMQTQKLQTGKAIL